MIFSYPEFLLALTAVSVPIIIHLFNFRRFKKVYFSDIRFLKDVEIETKSRNKLKNLLILASRMLAITFLVLAFARPVIPTGKDVPSANSAILVYIDNSFSMSAEGEQGLLLEEAKAKAVEIGSVYANGGELRLLTNDFDPRHFRSLSFEEFKNEVTAVQASPVVRTFDEVAARAIGTTGTNTATNLYYISDLQATTSTPTKSISDSLLSIYAIPLETQVETNLYVDSCWFESPSRLPIQPDRLMVRVRNTGTKEVENVSVVLTLNGIQRAVGTATIAATSSEDVELPFKNAAKGIQFAEVSIQDYPITFDDRYHLSFQLGNTVRILSINGPSASKAVSRVFDSEPNFSLTEASSVGLDFSTLNSTDLVICNGVPSFSSGMVQELMRYVNDGGDLLFVVSEKADLQSTNELLLAIGAEQLTEADSAKMKVEGVNLKSDLFKNVFTQWEERIDLPVVNKHYGTAAVTTSSAERLMTLANGEPLLTAYRSGKGRAYVLTSAVSDAWTNFHRHALFVPALYNMALYSVNNSASAETIGSDRFIPVQSKLSGSEILEVKRSGTEQSFVPERVARAEGSGIFVHDQIRDDGQFLITTETGDTLQPLSFNYDRSESEMQFLSSDELLEKAQQLGMSNLKIVDATIESMANQVRELHDGKQLWRLFLILALLALLAETILIRIL